MNVDDILRKAMIWHGGDTDYDAHFKEAKKQIQELIVEAREEAEVALARKVLAVSSGVVKRRGVTQTVRLKLLTDKMMEIIGDDGVGIIETESTQPKTEVGGE